MDELSQICQELDAEVAAASPRCQISGRCCRFREYGHRLYLSRMEAEWLLAQGLPPGATIDEETCPFQSGVLCTARERRPLACRVFYCDPAFADKQVELAEEYIARLKQLHERTSRPWEYAPLWHFLQEHRDRTREPAGPADGTVESA